MPLRMDNKIVWSEHFKKIDRFIRGLHHTNPSAPAPLEPGAKKPKKEVRVVDGPRKKGFLGFIINFQSYTGLFNKYVEEKQFLASILGHKLSQDHLEIMFGTIRSSLGLNNNPTVIRGC
jgi:hypothetical protein